MEIMETFDKPCIECNWCAKYPILEHSSCKCPELMPKPLFNPVTGENLRTDLPFCSHMRRNKFGDDNVCGENGKYFTPIPPSKPNKIKTFLFNLFHCICPFTK